MLSMALHYNMHVMKQDQSQPQPSTGASRQPTAPPFVDRRKRKMLRKFYRLFSWGMIDLDFQTVVKRILQLEIVAFAGIIASSWINEVWDLPHLVYGVKPSPQNYYESTMETGWALLVLAFVLAITQVFMKQIKHLEGFLPVCSFCKSIRVEEKWKPIEQYMHDHTKVKMTHSLCPGCAKKHYGYEEGEDGDQEA